MAASSVQINSAHYHSMYVRRPAPAYVRFPCAPHARPLRHARPTPSDRVCTADARVCRCPAALLTPDCVRAATCGLCATAIARGCSLDCGLERSLAWTATPHRRLSPWPMLSLPCTVAGNHFIFCFKESTIIIIIFFPPAVVRG